MNYPTPHINATPDDFGQTVLMPGDPLRAKAVAEKFMTDVVCFNDTRNMLGFTGTYKGKRISVMGHGMGVPSIGIYTQELYSQFGVEAIIRIGSAGGLDMDVDAKDVVIAEAASSNSNYGNAFPDSWQPAQITTCSQRRLRMPRHRAATTRSARFIPRISSIIRRPA